MAECTIADLQNARKAAKMPRMNEDAYYDRLLREYDRDVWADLAREAEERLAAGDIACDRWRDDGC